MEYNALAHGQPSTAQNTSFSQFSQAGIASAYAPDASMSMYGGALSRLDAPPTFQQMAELQKQREEAQALKTAQSIAALQAKLNQKLGPEYISQRPGPSGGPKLTYAEGWKVINLANEVFGFNGWSSSITSLTVDFIDYNEQTQRYSIGVTAIVRVLLRDGVSHEDVGYGILENSKSKGAALDKCKKEAVTDALKRTLRTFGNVLGNCLYDKEYTKEILKMKVPGPIKLESNTLHRRKEFAETTPPNKTHPPMAPPPPPAPRAAPTEPRPVAPKAADPSTSTNSIQRSGTDESLYAMGEEDDSMFADFSFGDGDVSSEGPSMVFTDLSRHPPPQPTASDCQPAPRHAPSSVAVVVEGTSKPPELPAASIGRPPEPSAVPASKPPQPTIATPASSSSRKMSAETRSKILDGLFSPPPATSTQSKGRTSSGGGFVIPAGVTRPQRPSYPPPKLESGLGTKRGLEGLTTTRSVLGEIDVPRDGSLKRPRLS